MGRELEVRTGLRIDAALDRIRSKMSLTGMAAKWHLAKASDIIRNPHLIARDVGPLGEAEEAEYLNKLPALIAKIQEQDRRCSACWCARVGRDNENQYLVERAELMRLFQLVRLRLKLYERVARQSDKPLLRSAISFVSEEHDETPEVVQLEAIIRMRLPDFIKLETDLINDFFDLDAAREELFAANAEIALSIARSQPQSNEATESSALAGLRRAAAWYDHKAGYSFEAYAQEWIQEAIDKRRE
jgi:hypothetical protein